MIYKLDLIGDVTPNRMIEAKYDRAKNICLGIWDKPKCKCDFEDIFHDTIYRCLSTLENKKFSQDYLKAYFFKAFRINMIRYFGYAYNKLTSGIEIENAIIPIEVNYDNHLDGFGMLDYVEKKHGTEAREILWKNLNGITFTELDKEYDINTYYFLSKIKNEIKRYYNGFIYKRLKENIE